MKRTSRCWLCLAGLFLVFLVACGVADSVLGLLRLSHLGNILLGALAYAALFVIFAWVATRAGLVRWIPARSRNEL